MVELYRARFSLGNEHKKPTFEEAAAFLNRKMSQISGMELILPTNSHESMTDNQSSIQTAHVQTDHGQLYAIQWKSCKETTNWTVDVGLREGNGEDPLVEITMGRDRTSDILAPSRNIIKRPGIVPALITQFGAHGFDRLSVRPFRITRNNVESFVDFIRNPRRDLPVVFLTCSNTLNKPLIDPVDIASQLAGVSYVFFEEDKTVADTAKEKFGDLRCFNGAVRLYWPMQEAQLFHPFFKIEDQRQQRSVPATICRRIYETSVARPALINYQRILTELSVRERQELMKRIAESKSLGDYEELVRLYETEITELKDHVGNLQGRVETLAIESQRNASERDALRLGTIELQRQLAEAQAGVARVEPEPEKPLESMKDAYDRYLETYAEVQRNIVFHQRGLRKIEKSKFRDPETFFKLLCWINDTYVPSKRGDMSVPDLDVSCRQNVDMTYVANQSPVTMGEHPEEYELVFDGRKYQLEEHFRRGSSRDEGESLRVAGVTLPEKYASRFLLGYVGFHQPNRKT